MNQTHIHLVITHLPVIGSILGAFILIYGMLTKSCDTKNSAYFIFIFCAIGAVIAYITGEAAEETVENIAGVSEAMIEKHENAAKIALASMIFLGFSALIALVLSYKKSVFAKSFSYITLIISLIAFGITIYTANLGGKIRHIEILNVQGLKE